MEGEQVVGDALRIRRRAENLLAVGAQLLQPGRDVGGVVGEIAVGDAEFGADHHLADLGPQFLAGVVMRAEPVAQIAVEPRLGARPVTELMNQRPAKSFRRGEGRVRRHLDVIRRRRVERAFAADPDDGAAVGENDLRRLRRAPRRFLDRGRDVVRNAVDLAGVEQGERAQQRNAPHRVFVVLRPGLVVAQLKPLEEKPGRAALALADLPAPVFRLLVGRPARIAAR